jgi:hypothetical protein
MELVAFIPELEMQIDTAKLAHYRAHLLHACYRLLLSPIKELQKDKRGIEFYNAASREIENFLPLLGEFQGDIPEKLSVTGKSHTHTHTHTLTLSLSQVSYRVVSDVLHRSLKCMFQR